MNGASQRCQIDNQKLINKKMTPKEVPCTRCQKKKPQTEENFCRDKRKEGIGYFTVCRECTRAREKEKYDRKKNEISYF